MLALDIETAPENNYPKEYALQPWRLIEGKAKITNVAIGKDTGESMVLTSDYRSVLAGLEGSTVYGWNLVFDVAWLIAADLWDEVKRIKWVDAMLLWKWLDNSQRKELLPAWSLSDGAKHFYPDETWLEPFLRMKATEVDAGVNDQYWEVRAKLDAIVTARIARAALGSLSAKQLNGALIEAETIPEVARSWVDGVHMDFNIVDDVLPAVAKEMIEIEFRLGVSNYRGVKAHEIQLDNRKWQPSQILRSPKKLGKLLYQTWKLTPRNFTDKGQPSTDKAALTYLADEFERVIEILRWRELNTQLTKYLQSPLKARSYLDSTVLHPAPRIFSTYTGRFTYTSKTKGKPTGMALHQWPRNKAFRALIVPPKGYKHVEYDAAGQESRIMAHQSSDAAMIDTFKRDKKFHAMTGAKLAGMSYEDFMSAREAGNSRVTGEHGLYYQGKFTNLSNNFRIGVKKLRVQARVQYGMTIDFMTAKQWQDTFFMSYPGIKIYWRNAIALGRSLGQAESLGGRQFRLTDWNEKNRWATESSAIMFPIQGTGADMKNLAIRELARHYPEFVFWFDLHDGIHMLVQEHVSNERLLEARTMLNNMDYKKEWGVDLKVPLTWDCSVGPRWSELEEL